MAATRFTIMRVRFLGAVAIASLPLALACRRPEAPTFAHALPESFSLFRCHVLAALFHATSEIGATGTVPSMSAEKDPAQRQKSKRLPEGDLAPADERRQQPIPQAHHDFAAEDDKCEHRQNRQWSKENPFPSHVHFL